MKNFQDFTLTDYLRILRRRIWYLILPLVLVSVGTVVYVSQMPSVYKSETSILVSDRLLPEDYIGSLVRQSVADRIDFARQQLRSRTFVERVAQEFQLGGVGANIEQVLDAVISSTEVTVVPPNVFKVGFYSLDPNVAQAVTRRLAERVMQTNDTFRQERVNTADQFLEEELRQAADDLANAEQALRAFNQTHFPGVPEQGVNIETLTSMQAQLAAAQSDLQATVDQSKAYERTLTEHRELKLATTEPRPAPPAPPPTVIVTTEPTMSPLQMKLAQRTAELAALLTRYTSEHPDVSRLRREIADLESQIAENPPPKVPSLPAVLPNLQTKPLPEIDVSVDFYEAEVLREQERIKREISRKEASTKELSRRIAAYGQRMNMAPGVMQELATLTQTRETARQRHSYLSTRKLNSDLSGKVDTSANNKTFTTIDPPNLPQRPVRPNRVMLTTAGCLGGFLLGISLVLARELFDPTLGDEESAAQQLKMKVFTSIPIVGKLKRRDKKLAKKRKKEDLSLRRALRVSDAPLTQDSIEHPAIFSLQKADSGITDVLLGRHRIAGEQFQMVRAELAAQRQRGTKSLLITSSVPNEGKTFVACCLAGILARERGKKVLLVDGDLRTANAGRLIGFEHRDSLVGLSDILAGKADVQASLIPCADLNLSFLPAGQFVENPVELLSSPRLQQVMLDLTLLFDWVIVDSPPNLPIADAGLLIPVCDTAIVVVRADKTPVSLIKESIKRAGPEKVSGIVMNCVRNIHATRYYGDYYNQLAQTHK